MERGRSVQERGTAASERRHHLAGALGSALLDRLFELGWIERTETRAVRLSETGCLDLQRQLGIVI